MVTRVPCVCVCVSVCVCVCVTDSTCTTLIAKYLSICHAYQATESSELLLKV